MVNDSPHIWPHGAQIRQLRQSKGWSQKFLAENAELSLRTIVKVEKGDYRVTLETIRRIAQALDIAPSNVILQAPTSNLQLPPSYHGTANENLVEALRAYIVTSVGESISEQIRRLLSEAIRLIATEGGAVPEFKETLEHAMALCSQEERPYYFMTLQGLCIHLIMQGQIQDAHHATYELLTLASHLSTSYAQYAHYTSGVALTFLGRNLEALDFHKRGPTSDPPEDIAPVVAFADLRVSRLCFMAHIFYALGYPVQAYQHIDQALAMAKSIIDSRTTVLALHFGALLYQLLRIPGKVEELSVTTIKISEGMQHLPWFGGGKAAQGWALVMQGHMEQGIHLIEEGIKRWQAAGVQVALSRYYTLLAEAYEKAGQAESGLQAIRTALQIMESTGDRHYAVETHRMRGILLLQQGTPSAIDEAEMAFQEALGIAEEQHAKSFALRVALSWGRHMMETSRSDKAKQLIGGIYEGFTEGADTRDHQEAQALLQQLS